MKYRIEIKEIYLSKDIRRKKAFVLRVVRILVADAKNLHKHFESRDRCNVQFSAKE